MPDVARQGRDSFGLARFGEPSLLILAALLDEPKHGYAIIDDVEKTVGVRLGPGTLYGALSKLEDRGLIRAVATQERRRPYEITADGRAAVESHMVMWKRFVGIAGQRLEQS